MKTVVTKKGTTLPLTNLKGKDYLMVAYRILWFSEETPLFHISTQFLVLDDVQTVAQVSVVVLNEQGQAVRKAVGTKRETKVDFSDHLEKAETGALGRALIQLGYGTQYALADLDEGSRLADSPLVDTRNIKPAVTPVSDATPPQTGKVSSFRKTKKEEPKTETTTEVKSGNGAEGEWL
jgi:hypothetical protein